MYRSILVPVDLFEPELTNVAVRQAATMSNLFGASVRLINVMPITPVMLAEYLPADLDTQQRETAQAEIDKVAVTSGIPADKISTVVRQGGIYHEILSEADTWKADLVLMTSHRPAMRTYFLGSNAGHVVRYAKCSVLVVR